MIVVIARIQTTAEHRDELLEVAHTMCRASREEDGCLGYRIHEDTEEPNHFVFIEEWQDDEAIQRHFGQPHTADFMGAFPGLLDGPIDLKFHTVERTQTLGRGGLVDA
jgi:quinol monooxygenase YgiN